jgi:hypothetical protein
LSASRGSSRPARTARFRFLKDTCCDVALIHAQQLHVHPSGTKVLYTAVPQAYGQVFIVDVPEWDAMPDRSAVTKNKEV